MIYGYARVSTKGQERNGYSLECQREELLKQGATVIYSDAYTGAEESRPELDKLMEILQVGDTLIVTKMDRIARSVKEGISIIEKVVEGKGANVHLMGFGTFENTPANKLMRNMMLAVAEFERDMIRERTMEGKARARLKPGFKEGRPRNEFEMEQFDIMQSEVKSGAITANEAAKRLGISRATYFNIQRKRSA